MKNLKKLSVAIMLAALFSTSFTSCIDGEVSHVVESLYQAQADLLAAQAGVLEAEAALLMAQAETEASQADLLDAQAAAQNSSWGFSTVVMMGDSLSFLMTSGLDCGTFMLTSCSPPGIG